MASHLSAIYFLTDVPLTTQVGRRVRKTGVSIDVMLCLENFDGRAISLKHYVIERFNADADAVAFG
jgi:hypothetical protein